MEGTSIGKYMRSMSLALRSVSQEGEDHSVSALIATSQSSGDSI